MVSKINIYYLRCCNIDIPTVSKIATRNVNNTTVS